MGLRAAHIDSSERLQRVHRLLSDRREHSTMEIISQAQVCAVNSIIAELRSNGADIHCRQTRSLRGTRIWLYRMTVPAATATKHWKS